MGWSFGKRPRHELIEDLTRTTEYEGVRHESLRHSCVGNCLWSVIRKSRIDGSKEPVVFIALFLLQKMDGQWGYKDMDESVGPYYYNCPLSFLDEAPPIDQDWRAKVRLHHERRRRKIEVGRRYTLIGSTIPEVKICALSPLSGLYGGTVYRVRKGILGDLITEN